MASNGPPHKKRKVQTLDGEDYQENIFTGGRDPVETQNGFPFDTSAQHTQEVPNAWCAPPFPADQLQMFINQQQQKESWTFTPPRGVAPQNVGGSNGTMASLMSHPFIASFRPDLGPTRTNLPASVNPNKRKRSSLFFDYPLGVVQPQRRYMRNQLHLSLANGGTLCESDFSDNEGTVTLYKMTNMPNEVNPMVWTSMLKPFATLYAPHVSKIFSDEKFLYSVTGGEDLWLTWWEISANYQMQQLNLTHKLIPLKIDLPVVVTCTLVDKNFIYIGINKGHIIILDKSSKRISKVLKLKANTFPHMLKTDDVYLYAAFSDATVRLWYKLDKWKKKKHVFFDKNEKNVVKAVEVIGKNIYVAFTKAIQIWERIDNNNFKEIISWKTESDLQAFAVDNDLLYVALSGTIEVRTKALAVVNSVPHNGVIRNLFIDKSTLYVDSHPLVALHSLTLARIDELKEVVNAQNPEPTSGIRITLSDPQFILGGCRDGRVLIWKRETNNLVAVIPPPASPNARAVVPLTGPVNQMVTSFAANKNYFFVGYFTGQLRVIERASFCHESVNLVPASKNAHKHAILRTSCYVSHIYVDEEILIVSHADGTVVFSYLKDINFGDNADHVNMNYMNAVMLNEQINTQMNPVVEKPTANNNGGSFTLNTVFSFKVQRHKNLIYIATTNGYITVFTLQPQVAKIAWLYFGTFSHATSFYADDKHLYVSYAEAMNRPGLATNMNRPPSSNPASPSPSPVATPEVQRRNQNDPPAMANFFVKIYSVEGSINELTTISTNFAGSIYSIFADTTSLYVCSKYGELKVFKKDAKFALDLETKCNWREIESLSKIPYSTFSNYPSFLPAYGISEQKWVDPKESKTRNDVDAASITPAFSINDSCVVVSRIVPTTPEGSNSPDPAYSPRPGRGIVPVFKGTAHVQDTSVALALTFD